MSSRRASSGVSFAPAPASDAKTPGSPTTPTLSIKQIYKQLERVFFSQVKSVFGFVQKACTPQSCPTMTAGPRYEFLWVIDGSKDPPQSLPACQYITNLFDWIELMQMDYETWSSGDNAASTLQNIFKRLFRVFAHIYYSHYTHIISQGKELELNTTFKHFMQFCLQHSLLTKDDMRPLKHLITHMKLVRRSETSEYRANGRGLSVAYAFERASFRLTAFDAAGRPLDSTPGDALSVTLYRIRPLPSAAPLLSSSSSSMLSSNAANGSNGPSAGVSPPSPPPTAAVPAAAAAAPVSPLSSSTAAFSHRVHAIVRDLDNGSYLVSYVATTSGEYHLHVTASSAVRLLGTPVRVIVLSSLTADMKRVVAMVTRGGSPGNDFSDLRFLTADGRRFAVHKSVLAARLRGSPALRSLLQSVDELRLSAEVPADAFAAFLEFLYSGHIDWRRCHGNRDRGHALRRALYKLARNYGAERLVSLLESLCEPTDDDAESTLLSAAADDDTAALAAVSPATRERLVALQTTVDASLSADFLAMVDNDELYPDVAFIVGADGSPAAMQAHRVVLAARSEYFGYLFSLYRNQRQFSIPDMEAGTFRRVLDWLYSGRLPAALANVGGGAGAAPSTAAVRLAETMLAAANRFALFGLRDACARFLHTANGVVAEPISLKVVPRSAAEFNNEETDSAGSSSGAAEEEMFAASLLDVTADAAAEEELRAETALLRLSKKEMEKLLLQSGGAMASPGSLRRTTISGPVGINGGTDMTKKKQQRRSCVVHSYLSTATKEEVQALQKLWKPEITGHGMPRSASSGHVV